MTAKKQTELDRLTEALENARDDLRQSRDQSEEFVRRAVEDFRDKFQRVADKKFGPGIASKEQAVERAREALEAEAKRLAETGEGMKLKPGTKLLEWASPRFSIRHKLEPTGVAGVIEVWTESSARPENLSRWRIPSPGSVVLRILKKDGTLSSKFVHSDYGGEFFNWLPEGRKPEKRKERIEL